MASVIRHLGDVIWNKLAKGFKECSTSFLDENGISRRHIEGDILEITTDSINLASAAAGASSVASIADATGVKIGDLVLGVVGDQAAGDPVYSTGGNLSARVVNTNTITLQFSNVSAGALDPGAGIYKIFVMKRV